MEKTIEDERIFSESKKGINYSILATVGIVLLLAIFAIVLTALTIATLSAVAIHYFGPTKFGVFTVDLSPALDWLVVNELTIFLLTLAAYIIVWLFWREIKKESAERRLANKILVDKGMEPL